MKEDSREETFAGWLAQLRAEEPSVRLRAAAGLCRLGSEEAVLALVGCLKDEDVHVRKMAALGLGEMAGPLEVVVPALLEVLGDSDGGVRRRAGVALSEILAAHPKAWGLIQSGLAHPNGTIRQQLLAVLASSEDRRAA